MKPHSLLLSFAASLLCVSPFSFAQTPAPPKPLDFPSVPATPPEKAASTFEVLDGFTMDLVAAEPLVTDPVAITYDEYGRAFVCEMNDYPYTDKAKHKVSQENPTDLAIGKVRLLTDTDGDGVYDRSTIFATDLSWPTGAACWKGGIIVVATPDIWYLKDTDNDGVADVRQKLFTGLKKLNIQAVANNPIWGLDNKIYIAGGTNGGTVQNLIHPDEKPVTIRRADLKLDPVTMKIEATDGGARFGNTRDDWGNRFLCNIRNPCQHIVYNTKYLSLNPYVSAINPLHDAAEAGDQLPVHRISPPEAWRVLRADRWSTDPTNRMPRSELVGTGVVTSSAGITIYRGDAYPQDYRGMAFVADVAGNLFYRLKLTPDSVTFKATRVDGDKEFCASRDIWFRPVNFANAPDGCLHVCDMYREAIEHPWSLPDDIHAAIDLIKGIDKGRIWRLTPKGYKTRKTESLADKSSSELVKLFSHPNAWHRDTAHRLLFERQDKSVVPELKQLLKWDDSGPYVEVHSMWTLNSLGALDEEDLSHFALEDREPEIRESATILYAPFLTSAYPPSSFDNRLKDESPRIRFLATLVLANSKSTSMTALFDQVILRNKDDPWMRLATQAFRQSDLAVGVETTLRRGNPDSPGLVTFIRECGVMLGSEPDLKKTSAEYFLAALARNASTNPHSAEQGLLGLCEGLARHGRSPSDLLEHLQVTRKETAAWLRSVSQEAQCQAGDDSLGTDERVTKIGLMAVEPDITKIQPALQKLLLPAEPDAVRLAVISLLQRTRAIAMPQLLLEAWSTLTPAPREAALQALASRAEWIRALISAVENGRVKPGEISATARTLMLRTPDTVLKARVEKLFSTSSRGEVLAKYQPALTIPGDAKRGKVVFTTVCAACHRFKEEGRDVGPNLATTLAWTPEQMLTNILDPNREVSPNFAQYLVELQDGRFLVGMLTGESEASIMLKDPMSVEQSVIRSQIKSLKSTGLSLMPEGLESVLTVEQLADLMAYLRTK
ncbi:putative membrane-bound dehydrogenase-like protein [Roseimicrobium gellanilyticum]|uniref:Putative membrane-bound dehydrogenase-like protein n=1 Tax=Roseimicrobium gellanilyticum TaxID=748857 RepID=A0A366HTX1_9BACT|nr:PVC-type heme-binding CxxCH protein [Roseimicrobium gellanilyticum]RBP47731.1 putative membrane-bound dehydrogenase-like protein [Roseimicrobium gellanilyticum]